MWIIDSNVYIRAFNDTRFGAELIRFHTAELPRIVLSAVVVFELLVGSRTPKSERALERGLLDPFRSRGRVHIPALSTWELAADIDRRLRKLRAAEGSLRQRSFSNDILIAASARQLGATIVTENMDDFDIIGRVIDIHHLPPWP